MKTYSLHEFRTGKHVADYTFASEPQNGDKIQPGGVDSAEYTIVRYWDKGELTIQLTRSGIRQVSNVRASGGSHVSGVTQISN